MGVSCSPDLRSRGRPPDGWVPAGTWLGLLKEGWGARRALSPAAPGQLRPTVPPPTAQPDSAPCPLRARTAPTRAAPFPLSAPPVRAVPPLPPRRGGLFPAPRPAVGLRVPPGRGARTAVRRSPLRARRRGRAARPPTWRHRAVRRRGRLWARGSRSRPGSWWLRRRLLLQEGAESSDFLLKGQLPPIDHTQRASSRQHPSQPLSLPPRPRPRPRSLAPPRVRSGGRGPGPARRGWAAPRVGAAPTAGSPGSPGRPSPAAASDRGEPGAQENGVGGGRGEAWEIPGSGNPEPGASVSSSVKREGERVGPPGEAFRLWHLSPFKSPD